MTIPKTCTRFICMLLLICMALACVPQLLPPAQAASTTKGFTISAKNTTVFKDTAMKTKLGTIFPDDELILVQITNSYTKVTYGVTGTSRTKTGYIPTSAVLIKPSGSVITAGAKITTYRRNSTASTYGYIAKGTADQPDTILGTFCTMPAIKNPWRNFLCEVIATCLLVFIILALGTKGNAFAMGDVALGTGSLGSWPVTCLIMAIGMSLGGTTGYALNPARDLSPRCAHALLPIAGKRDSGWWYSWIPVVGPMVGCAIAAGLFILVF